MRVSRVLVTTLSLVALMSTGVLEGHAQSNNQLDQITVDTGQQITAGEENQKPTNDVEGTILENPAVGVPGVVVTYQDFERIQPQDLQDVFANETSVSVGGSTPVTQKIYVNGIEDSRLAVTIDGAAQSSATFHHVGTLLIDPSLLKAVRIDPTVAPADAGPGALGGSVQLETVDVKDLLDPGKTMGGFITGSYDTNSKTFSSGVSGYARSNGFEVLGYYKILDGDNWEAGNGQEQDVTAQHLKTALGKVAYEALTGDRFELSYEWVNDDAIRPYRPNFAGITRPGFENQPYELQRQNFVFTYTDEKPKGWWDPKLVIAYNETNLDNFDLDKDGETEGTGDIETWSGKFQNKFNLQNGDVTAGVDFFHSESYGGYVTNGFNSETDRNIGVFSQARFDVMKEFRVSFGGRIDHQMFTGQDGTDLDDTGFSGNISAEYDLNEIFTLKAGYAHVFGRIPLLEAYLNYHDIDYSGVETYDSDNFTVGLAAEYSNFTFDIDYSHIVMDGALTQYPEPKRTNTDIKSKTFNVAVGYKWATGFAKAAYSNIDVTADDDVIGTTSFYYGTNIGELITLQVVHGFEGTGITIGADAQIALEQDEIINDGFANLSLPAYEVFNAFIQYEPESMPKITLRAEVKNITDENYVHRATSGQEYDSVYPLLEPGRSVYFSAKAKF